MARKKKAAVKVAKDPNSSKNGQQGGQVPSKTKSKGNTRFEHGTAKYEHRKRDQRQRAAANWDVPPPPNLVAKLDVPKHKSKYHSYFEFAENTEKKKKLEFEVTNDPHPQPGFKFVPIGDPLLTSKCKELSREHDAMIFIVSGSKETLSKVSEHVHRTGYQFREYIVDEAVAALEAAGETILSRGDGAHKVEPIPETQEEINKQADGAIRDLFPRIPNTDRQIIIDHAFQKGAMFHGEPVVGLQPDLPLYRRVQLAVLAHIRHTHTRYDKLLRETSWANARKVVEPVCLDFLVKWRGDEETGRDQMDEILREVVIITDSEDSEDSDEEDDSSDEDGDNSSVSSEGVPQPSFGSQLVPPHLQASAERHRSVSGLDAMVDLETAGQHVTSHGSYQKSNKAQRGFSRYRAAWEQAVERRNHVYTPTNPSARNSHVVLPPSDRILRDPITRPYSNLQTAHRLNNPNIYDQHVSIIDESKSHRLLDHLEEYLRKQDTYHASQRPIDYRKEVFVRPGIEAYKSRETLPRARTPSNFEQRPSQVVRGSPSNGLKDMLVPSIEYERSSDALTKLPRRDVRRSRPPVIIIDDSPPQIKRRCVADESGLSRPVSPTVESYLVPVSSARARDSLVQHSRVQSQAIQGLSRGAQSGMGAAPVQQRLPIYDATPDDEFHFESNHRTAGRTKPGVVYGQWEEYRPLNSLNRDGASLRPVPERVPGTLYSRQPAVQNVRVSERDHINRHQESSSRQGSQMQRQAAPSFPIHNTDSRLYEHSSNVVSTHGFSDRPFQSRTDSPIYRTAGDSAPMHGNSSYHNFQPPINAGPSYPIRTDRASTNLHHLKARSPLPYMDSSLYPIDDRRQNGFYKPSSSYNNHIVDQSSQPQLSRIGHEFSHNGQRNAQGYSRYVRAPPGLETASTTYSQPRHPIICLD